MAILRNSAARAFQLLGFFAKDRAAGCSSLVKRREVVGLHDGQRRKLVDEFLGCITIFCRYLCRRDLFGNLELLEFRYGLAKLGQPDLSSWQHAVGRLNGQFVVDVAEEFAFLESHFEVVPLAGLIVFGIDFGQDIPLEHVGTVKAT